MLRAPGQLGQVVNSAAKVNVPIERIELKDVADRHGRGRNRR